MINVALPKGRLGEKVYQMFEKAGYECPSIKENTRKLIFGLLGRMLHLEYSLCERRSLYHVALTRGKDIVSRSFQHCDILHDDLTGNFESLRKLTTRDRLF